MMKMKDVLMKRRQALRQALTGDMSLLSGLSDHQATGDVVDWAIDAAQDELSSQLAEVESRELAQVEQALERMRSGQYGLCEDCDQPIPTMRLQALPYATCCVECQRKSEAWGVRRGNALPLVSFGDELSDAELEVF
jgi:DnaK suppressor protein